MINKNFPTGPLDQQTMRKVINSPAYWAFCWGSGVAAASWIKENGAFFEEKTILDIGSGSGIAGIAACLAGAKLVFACDVDADARAATGYNAQLNDRKLTIIDNINSVSKKPDVVLLSDVLYDNSNLSLLDHPLIAESNTLIFDSRIKNLSAKGFENFKFFRGYKAEDLVYEGERVSGVKISNLDEDIFVSGKVVIGFDGRNSMVRRKLAFSVEKFHQPADVLWFKVPYPENFIPGSQAFFSLFPMSMLVCVPVYDQKMQVGWVIPSGSYGELKQQGKEKWIEFIRENSPKDFSDHLKDCLDKNEISDPFVLKMTLFFLFQ